MTEELVIRATFNGEEIPPITLKRNAPKLPKVPEGYIIVPVGRMPVWVSDYLDLPDKSYVELRWKPMDRRHSSQRTACPTCGKVFRTHSGRASHNRHTGHGEVHP